MTKKNILNDRIKNFLWVIVSVEKHFEQIIYLIFSISYQLFLYGVKGGDVL
jgi:hypothetical protein